MTAGAARVDAAASRPTVAVADPSGAYQLLPVRFIPVGRATRVQYCAELVETGPAFFERASELSSRLFTCRNE